MNNIIKNKKIYIFLIVVFSVVGLATIFGIIDNNRAINGKKPIFIFYKAKVFNTDINKKGIEYYGIGYKISNCESDIDNYSFQFGYKKNEICATSLTCNETEAKNFKTTYKFLFDGDKLYRLTAVLVRQIDESEDEKEFTKEYKKLNNIVGVEATIKKIHSRTYKIEQSCNLTEISINNIEKGCLIGYFDAKEIPELTRTKIIEYFYKAMDCE